MKRIISKQPLAILGLVAVALGMKKEDFEKVMEDRNYHPDFLNPPKYSQVYEPRTSNAVDGIKYRVKPTPELNCQWGQDFGFCPLIKGFGLNL